MIPYTDKWERWHDKPCKDGEPSSNNAWIYSAYSKKLGFPFVNLNPVKKLCTKYHDWYRCYWTRHPEKDTVPFSRDEVLGMCYLGLIFHTQLVIINKWSFCPYAIPKFNPIKTIQALLRMRKAHRNALWQNGGEPHLFRFAFSVPLQDRASILRWYGRRVPIFYRVIENISQMVKNKSNSSRLIDWLKYGNKPDLKLFEAYFGKDHPFCGKIRNDG